MNYKLKFLKYFIISFSVIIAVVVLAALLSAFLVRIPILGFLFVLGVLLGYPAYISWQYAKEEAENDKS